MPSVSKRHIGLIPFVQSETTYGQGGVIVGANAIGELVAPLPFFDIEYADNGDRGMGEYTRGRLAYAAPTGRTAKGTYKIRYKGNTVSGSLSGSVPNHHPFWLGAGLSGSLEQGLSAWVFKPLPVGTNPTSFCMNIYSDGEMLPLSGAYCTMTYGATGAKEVDFDYAIQGLAGAPIDATPPARTFPAVATVGPTAKNIQLSIGSFTSAVVRSHKFTWAPTISPRVDQNSINGHSGFDIVGGEFSCTLIIEAPAKATIDFDADRDNATQRALSLQLGSATGNILVTSMPLATLTTVKRAQEGNISTYELTYVAVASAPDASDGFSITAK